MKKMTLEIENSLEIAELRAEIVSKRNNGEVLLEVKKIVPDGTVASFENPREIIDLFVTQLGYASLDARWKEINQEEAQKIINFIMTKDLAYSVQLMSLQEAEKIFVKLFHFFSSNSKFFTNASFINNVSAMNAWDSITKATFDTGVVILSDTRIGMVWVKDED